jgi:hypothetical protein
MAKLADLIVSLTVETASFRRDLNTANKTVKDFGEGLTGTFGQLQRIASTGLQAFGVAMAVDFVKSTTEAIGSLELLSQKIGISVEDLGTLTQAAKLFRIDGDGLAKSVGLLSKAMAGFDNDENKGASLALQNIGISAKTATGEMRPTVAVMLDIADVFAGMEDGAEKTALAMKLFGRSGKDMIPFLNQGAAGIRAMQEEAKALGLELDGNTAKAAERFNQNLTRLEGASRGLSQTLVTELLPSLIRISDGLVEAAKSGDKFTSIKAVGATLDVVIATVSSIVTILRVAIDYVGKFFGAIGAAVQLIAKGDFAGLKALDERLQKELLDPFRDAGVELRGVWQTSLNGIKEDTDSSVSLIDKRINAVLFGIRSAKSELANGLSGNKEANAIKAARDEYANTINQLTELWANSANRRGEIEQAALLASQIRDAKIAEATKDSTNKRIADAKRYAEEFEKASDKIRAISQASIQRASSESDDPFVKIRQQLNKDIDNYNEAVDKLKDFETKGPQRIGGFVVAAISDSLKEIDKIGDETKAKIDEILGKVGELKAIDVSKVPIIVPTTLPTLAGNDFYSKFIASLTANKKNLQKELDDLLGVRQFKASIDEIVLETGKASAGVGVFFRQYADYATNAAKVAHDAFARVFSALEDQLTNLLAHLKFDLNSFIDTIKESIARAVVQKFVLGPIAKGLGKILGLDLQKADGSKDNPFHVLVDNGGVGGIFGGGSGSSSDSGDSGDGGDSSSGILGKIQGVMGKVFSAIGSFFKAIGSALVSAFKFIGGAIGHLFGGGFADGGFLGAGQWGIAGENGPEPIFGGRTGVSVIPNHAAFGGSHTSNNIVNNFYLSPVRSDPFGYSQSQLANAVFTGNMRAMSRA